MDDASLISGVRDFHLLLIMPIAAYWISASIFHLFDCRRWLQAYKIHTNDEKEKRNKATLPQVFRQVVAQQAIQVIFALAVDNFLSSSAITQAPPMLQESISHDNLTSTERDPVHMLLRDEQWPNGPPSLRNPLSHGVSLALRLACAILIADFWQYFWHRIFHANRTLYKYVHSVHHRLYVPYSYGALYSSLTEAFVVDTIGTTVTFYLSGLSTLEATLFASLSIVKSVNDHSGYRFPCNPFDYLSSNTTDFHDVHHQSWGMKYNYSQVYLTIWDDVLGTTMPASEVALRRNRKQDAGVADKKAQKLQ
ncbi:hypothetical protein CERZMDRAFT_52879 [Cercospora zeae-maydis SCOH1-5]|uniref:Fatty acid hydroxylase domain-containing protein n=1 Tax=Cercospora zeae-maydis SCOH1-5 TaxID=717836 RepID=A0A6A6F2R8_9PEZI|nr:hypothetical protein CERZMDRAFT_52879 [Cercospora zeae-maydis SCOH1-5]